MSAQVGRRGAVVEQVELHTEQVGEHARDLGGLALVAHVEVGDRPPRRLVREQMPAGRLDQSMSDQGGVRHAALDDVTAGFPRNGLGVLHQRDHAARRAHVGNAEDERLHASTRERDGITRMIEGPSTISATRPRAGMSIPARSPMPGGGFGRAESFARCVAT